MIRLEVDGKNFTGWDSVEITASIKEISRSFTLGSFNELSKDIKPQSKCKVYDNDILLLTGYIEVIEKSYDANGSKAIYSGRSKSCDLVDCTPTQKKFKGKNLSEIINDICSEYNLKADIQVDLKKISYTQTDDTESSFDYLKRVCGRAGIVLTTDGKGSVVATRAGSNKLLGNITKIISASSVDNYTDRFSEYVIKGQTDTKNTQSTFKDNGVTRFRRKVYHDNTNDDDTDVSVKTQAVRLAGQGLTSSVTCYDYYTDKGELLQPNYSIYINDDKIGINQLMLIEGVRYSVGNDGRQATLDLVDPRAYFGEKPKISKSRESIKKHPQAVLDEKTTLQKAIEAGKL